MQDHSRLGGIQAAKRPPYPPGSTQRASSPRPRPKGRGLRAVLFTLIMLVAVGIILQGTLFRLRTVTVYGNNHRTNQEVETLAGLAKGQNILFLDENKIRDNINADRYLIFEDMQRDYPDGLILKVFERVPRANVQSMGVQYTLDGEGMVLEQTDVLQLEEGLIAVTGFTLSKCDLGQYVVSQSQRQLTAYRQVMTELAVQECISQVSELNLSDVDNLYLISLDGFSIRLGDSEEMRAKIGAMRAVLEKLREMGREKGSVDVSAPIHPTYIPAE